MNLLIADGGLRIGLRIGVALLGSFLFTHAPHAETIDRVLAIVAGQLITLTDVTAARDLGLQSAEGASDPVRAVLTKLIDRELVLAEVERYAPPEPTADAVDNEVQRVRERFPSQAALDAALERSGIDDKHLRETLRQDLRARAYLDQRFPAAAARRQALIDEWMAGLRRRGDVMDVYLPGAINDKRSSATLPPSRVQREAREIPQRADVGKESPCTR